MKKLLMPGPFRMALLVVPALWICSDAVAQPRVASVSSAEGGKVLSIQGSEFGVTEPSVIKWDSFDAGEAGSPLQGWELSASSGEMPTYSANRPRSTGPVARFAFRGAQYNANAGLTGLNEKEVFASYWYYIDFVSGAPSRNIKLARFATMLDGDHLHGNPSLGYTLISHTSGLLYSYSGTRFDGDQLWSTWPIGGWHRVDMYGKLSTPDVANGRRGFWKDGVRLKDVRYNEDALPTLSAASTKPYYETFTLGVYVAHDPGGDYDIYYDDVYLSRTRARVELCDTSSWPSGTTSAHCEIQPVTTWSPTAVTATLNMGSFKQLSGLFLYVVDAEGRANAAGVPVCTTNCAVVPGPPTSPVGVAVRQ